MASMLMPSDPQDAGDLGHDAGLIEGGDAQVVGGLDLRHGQHRDVGDLVGLEGQVGTRLPGSEVRTRATSRTSATTAGGGGQGPGAGAVVKGWADGVALDQDGVHGPVDIGDEPTMGDKGRVDAQLDAMTGAAGDAPGA